jgi:hypothetical protein
MNERTEALAKQAAEYAIEFATQDQELYIPKLMEKFAELIVRECASIYDKIDNGNLHQGTDNYLEALQKHFGDEDTEEDYACPLCGEDGGTTCGMEDCQY